MVKKSVKKIQTSGHSLKSFFLFATLIFLSVFVFDNAFGHGVGSETFPPVDLNGKQVTLEISSSKNDPEKNDDAVKFDSISYKDVMNRGLKIMDMTAFALSQENSLPIIVFDMNKKGNLEKVIEGENIGTIVDN